MWDSAVGRETACSGAALGSRGGFSGVFHPSRGDVVALDIYPGFFLPVSLCRGVQTAKSRAARRPCASGWSASWVAGLAGQRAPSCGCGCCRCHGRSWPGPGSAAGASPEPRWTPGDGAGSRAARAASAVFGFARFEGEGARLGEPTLPAAPCAKVDFCSHLASAEGASPRGPV